MKSKTTTFAIGFLSMGLFYGLLVYIFSAEKEFAKIIKSALFFGFCWGLAEVFVFPWIRNRFKKKL